jgi:hypothetical protein
MQTYIENETSISVEDFDKVANLLMNNSILKVNDNVYRICEIEFYLNCKEHEDQYTHMNDDQLEYGKFYFHKYKNGTYKAGTYKGMDITLGDSSDEKNTYCGILIRSIYDIKNKVFIEGPCRSVNKILEEYECDSVKDFTKNKLLNVLENKREFVIEDAKLKSETIYYGIRIGLSDKYPEFRNQSYRYLIMKDKIKKQKKDLKKID